MGLYFTVARRRHRTPLIGGGKLPITRALDSKYGVRRSLSFGAQPQFCGSTANWIRRRHFQLIHLSMNRRKLQEQI
jgi:hypothetical protein